MREILEQRLVKLKEESEMGHRLYAELKGRQAALAEQLLRISGAIQVLEDALANPEHTEAGSDRPVSLVASCP